MPSHLRLQSSFEPVDAQATYQPSAALPPAKKQKMSLTRTYAVASTARSKLGKEASRADHDLRLLVGHANLLDTLMIDLTDAEREQEAWFNSTVSNASKPEEPRHIQWFDTIAEDLEEDSDSDSDSDDGSDIYDEDAELYNIPLRKMRSPPVQIQSADLEEDYEDEDDDQYDEDDDEEHALIRVPSQLSPPELSHDDSDSEDDSMPPSPEQPMLELSEKEQQSLAGSNFFDTKPQSGMESYISQQPQQPFIAAY